MQDEEAAAAKYTTQHQQLLDAQSRVADLDAQLQDAEARLQTGEAGKEADEAKLAALTKELEGLAVLKAEKEALEDKVRHVEGEQAGQIKEKTELEQVSFVSPFLAIEQCES